MQFQRQKSLAVPAPGASPTFDNVADIALTAASFEQAICVMCLTQELLKRWMLKLNASDASVASLDTFDANRATLADWEAFLSAQSYDIVVLHGVRAELQARRLSVSYVKSLMDAIPSGLVMLV
jgi:hypothetical protein